jgi:sortase A
VNRRHGVQAVVALLLGLGTWQVASAAWIHAKALLAQQLIASAWDGTSAGGPARRPWPGADMRPIARLTVPARGVELYVLDNASPRALAFGPAHVGGTAAPGSYGNSVLVAHRDTHFRFLQRIETGDEVVVEALQGRKIRYRVSEVTIMDKGEARVIDEAGAPQLTLVTCWPFDAVRPGSSLRYVVVAERVA